MADEWCRCNVSRHGPCLGCGRPIRFAELRAEYERGVRDAAEACRDGGELSGYYARRILALLDKKGGGDD